MPVHTISRRGLLGGAAAASAIGRLHAEQETDAFTTPGSGKRSGAAQPWFGKAGLGLMICWGPCSLAGVEIGWGMFRDVGGANGVWPVEKYNALFDRFNPSNYDPDPWLAAAAKAGFKYTVFLTRHHDGYALWPSQFGVYSTRTKMGGRALIKPFVEATRRYGLKVGFYYSPGDWNFAPAGWPHHGFPLRDPEFKYRRPERSMGIPRYSDMPIPEMQRYFDQLYAYVKGQIGELLTRYGKIDLLWLDGYDWPIGIDHHPADLETHIRKLQPSIVLNARNMIWDKGRHSGDFSTEWENRNPPRRPEGAWEQCEAVCGGWSWKGENAACKSAAYLISRLVRNRAWGGNYLPSFGPRPDGTMPAAYFAICEQMASWMKFGAPSVFDAGAGPYPERVDVPATARGRILYLHFLAGEKRRATLAGLGEPVSARLLRTLARVPLKADGNRVAIELPAGDEPSIDEVVEVTLPA